MKSHEKIHKVPETHQKLPKNHEMPEKYKLSAVITISMHGR